MARRRLTPADPARVRPAPETKSITRLSPHPPIAQVAGEAAATAALEEITDSLAEARRTGRMVVDLPLGAVAADHLARDRILVEDAEFAALKESLRAHGQRTPIEVSPLEDPDRYGLISGWRRLSALAALHAETGADRFATVKALVRDPETATAAYVAMVEENEIRVGLSHYERARIVALVVERGVFPDPQTALRALFANVSRAKRSKIGSFLSIHAALGPVLRFPAQIGERLGLRLAQRLAEEPGAAERIGLALVEAGAETPAAEQTVLEAALKPAGPAKDPKKGQGAPHEMLPGVFMDTAYAGRKIRITLSGPNVTEELHDSLRDLLLTAGKTR